MLTLKQQQTFQFICQYIHEHGYAPTEAEIAAGIGIKSRGVVHRYVTAIANAGLIKIIPNRRRNIQLVKDSEEEGRQGLPILGRIAAGQPIEAVENELLLDVTESIMGPNRFILEVQGESMIGDNICDGDYIICEKAQTARENDIVIALIDGHEATLKRVQNNKNGTLTLLPSNPRLSPMVYPADQVIIQGIYVGLLRLSK